MDEQPTVFHLTHWKAGSQWVAAVLQECAPERFVKPQVGMAQILEAPLLPGGVYASLYVPARLFETVLNGRPQTGHEPAPEPWLQHALDRFWAHPEVVQANREHFGEAQRRTRKIVVVRDLRDTAVSYYFSAKVSHKILSEQQAKLRDLLNEMNEEDGLLRIIRGVMQQVVPIQLSYRGEDALHVRYEDLIADETGAFERIIDYAEIDVPRAHLHTIIARHSFERATGGRQRGTEDVTAHHRKGIAGDWQNYFTDHVKAVFKRLYGAVLIETGYETDLAW